MALFGLRLQELLEFLQSIPTVRYLVLLFGVHLSECLLVSFGLEDGVPAEHVLTAWCHDLALASADEDYGLRFAVLAVGNYALGVGGFVREASKEVVQTLPTKFVQEGLDVGTGQTLQGVEAK